MAQLIIHTDKIKENIHKLGAYFKERNIQWSLITKVFSGDEAFLEHVLDEETISKIDTVGDSRLTSLKNLRSVNPDMHTIYIKPPAAVYADDVVKYATVSLNSSFSTIKALNEAAKKQGIVHKIIIMIELGELREGVNRSDLISFYERVFSMKNINVIGIGSNLGCMYGVEPSYDKLLQLHLYKELIAAKFNMDLPLISGGTSITLPMLDSGMIPEYINHFRVGEAAFFGISPLKNERFGDLNTKTFEFRANIIELEEKKLVPEGVISDANIGHTAIMDEEDTNAQTYKAILDFGMLDVNQEDLSVQDSQVQFVGITSDMTVVDLGSNKNEDGTPRFKVGDTISFRLNYMAVARLLNSKFIDKVFK
ncbi:MAG: alanine racemase [bacterium]|nr:alanine racemase [bacterium]